MRHLSFDALPTVLQPSLVKQAYSVIRHKITKTPLLMNERISSIASRPSFSAYHEAQRAPNIQVYLKCENFQKTGSFKYRGVAHSIARLSDEELRRGLLTTSSGNHAKALATAARALARARRFSIPVSVVMPENASALKVKAVESIGAQVLLSGSSWAEREATLKEIRNRHNLTVISSSDNLNVILGQGTIAIEIVDQMRTSFGRSLDCVVVPCGGGGMLSGVAVALKDEPVKVFGAEPADGADDALRGLQLGYRVEKVTTSTIADGLRCPLGKLPWQVIRQPDLVGGIYTASEEHICATMELVRNQMDIVIEPSAAVPLAAVLFNEKFRKYAAMQKRPWHVGIVFSGGNCTHT